MQTGRPPMAWQIKRHNAITAPHELRRIRHPLPPVIPVAVDEQQVSVDVTRRAAGFLERLECHPAVLIAPGAIARMCGSEGVGNARMLDPAVEIAPVSPVVALESPVVLAGIVNSVSVAYSTLFAHFGQFAQGRRRAEDRKRKEEHYLNILIKVDVHSIGTNSIVDRLLASPAPYVMTKSWVTVVTTASYAIGAKVLSASLSHCKSQYPLLVLATEALPADARTQLLEFGLEVRTVEPLLLDSVAAGANRAAFAEAGNKLRAFALTEFETLGLLDADTLVTQNIDHLLAHDTHGGVGVDADQLAIAFACTCNNRRKPFYPREWTVENCGHTRFSQTDTYSHTPPFTHLSRLTATNDVALNSGVMVFRPSDKVCGDIEQFVRTNRETVQSYVFPDQQILQDVFQDRVRILPWFYNALKVLRVCHKPLWDNGASNTRVNVVHYIHEKPWSRRCESIAFPNNLPAWDADAEFQVDPSHAWWWWAHDNLLSREHQWVGE
ncbi:hypothetical protein E3P89_01185 [Wallemia ichthyophaga]|uniref:Nucleotide-diphospho-sugar transferase n=1 Tax=Wallemia ichthyophaga TaxID=245174 RepID=A0A4T0I7Y7_WALIC|nr:hypothetical protein E3P90_01586 [Wallemia ichthyophaga]TIB15324.1 hypothetical protein E3P93_01336 [Wallemia ichthyophaga]TIB24050.1 hypothetical protein E3P89_01185 [Wallemia ichthyophaga]TIB25398.1 hypothetical protein E3P88_01540 [Wallemia ichthyophaga]